LDLIGMKLLFDPLGKPDAPDVLDVAGARAERESIQCLNDLRSGLSLRSKGSAARPTRGGITAASATATETTRFISLVPPRSRIEFFSV
jgi:hypothetical protein